MTKALERWAPGHVVKDGQLVELERKELPFYVKVLDEAEGIVECYVAGIGNEDEVKDRILPGAFVDSLSDRNPKGVWSHDWALPIGKTLEAREVPAGDAALPEKMRAAGAGGLYVKAQFNLDTTRGREAFSDVVFFGGEQEWSIGFTVDKARVEPKTGVREILKLGLYEWSPVLFGANPITATAATKAAAVEGKVVQGSWEDELVRMGDALRELEKMPCYALATFDDNVVYMRLDLDEEGWIVGETTWRRPYTKEGDAFEFGEAEAVAIVETVQTRAARARFAEKPRPLIVIDADTGPSEVDAKSALEMLGLVAPFLDTAEGFPLAKELHARLGAVIAKRSEPDGDGAKPEEDEEGKPPAEETKSVDASFEFALMEFQQVAESVIPSA